MVTFHFELVLDVLRILDLLLSPSLSSNLWLTHVCGSHYWLVKYCSLLNVRLGN